MKPFPKIHDLYIGRVLFGTVLLTWLVLVGMDALIGGGGVLAEASNVGKGDYTFAKVLLNVFFTLPRRIYTLFPTAAVIGTLMGLGQLAASSELTALRALGLSRRRIGLAVAATISVLTLLMVVNGETLSPWSQRHADALKASSKDLMVAQYSGLWAREGDTFLNAQTGEERYKGNQRWLELRDVRLYEFDPAGRLQSIARAASAEHHPGSWLLHDVKRSHFDARSVTQTEAVEEHWASKLDDTALAASVTQPTSLSSSELHSGIEYRKRNGLDASELAEIYWGRWFYPLNVLALCLAAVPFAFGSLRSGGLGKRLFIGIVFALGFWLLQTQFVKLAGVYKFDYRIAYLVPPTVMLAVSSVLFRRRSS
jgi:lipopolysaccharide export system permease protein